MNIVLELTEYEPKYLPKNAISDELGELLWNNYGNQIEVQFPSPKTSGQWLLKNRGWAGHIPLSETLSLYLKPKTNISNLFGMLEYAYQLKSFDFLQNLITCANLPEFYNQLAIVLSNRINDRARKGFYRSFENETEQLSYIRGQIDFPTHIYRPWDVNLYCNYEDCTFDNEDNQILLWTLYVIIKSGLCSNRAKKAVLPAYRYLHRIASLNQYYAYDCLKRSYNRLNQDYRVLHVISRFFIEHSGPQLKTGNQIMLPFILQMSGLYQLFVAEWLKAHLPKKYELRTQEKVSIGVDDQLTIFIDMVIYDRNNNLPCLVLDTKYKIKDKVSNDDFSQIVTYSLAKDCNKAILVYPGNTVQFDEEFKDIRVRAISFSIEEDIEDSGTIFLEDLLKAISG